MGPVLRTLVLGVLLVASLGADERRNPLAADRVWFSPAPGSLDMRRLFEVPSEWKQARALVSVFKFYQQHTEASPSRTVGPNSYDALVRADAFRTLTHVWRKKIAIEVGAVKEFYCTPDAAGMQTSINNTLASVAAIEKAGGTVSFLAMDEPFLAGLSPRCGGPRPEATADRLRTYMAAVRSARPAIALGLIEPYPTFNVDALSSMLRLLKDRSVPPAFFHVDADVRAMRAGRDDFARDMTRLAAVCAEAGIPLGIIIWGHNGDADALFAADARRLADNVTAAFDWPSMPRHVIFQSWSESSTGLHVTPANLPEERPNTHTELLLRLFGQLRRYDGNRAVAR